jgi:fructose-bisphosphate aldolase class II
MTREDLLTDPDQAADFVKQTQCDALVIAIGTSHGAYKFTRKPTGDILAIERIKEIHARIPNTHLVMHGSSSVPQEWLAVIRKHGVRKINIDTDIRLAMTGAIRRHMSEKPSEFDPRKFLADAQAAARGTRHLQAALRSVRLHRAGGEDQADVAGEDGRALPEGRTEPDRHLSD